MKPFLSYILLLPLVWISTSPPSHDAPAQIVLVGSTPADPVMKSLLKMPADAKVDFIRWNLVLKETHQGPDEFTMDLVFGESQPNTLGFKRGGEERSVAGHYVHESYGKINGEVYRLRSESLPGGISIVKLNDNLFHFLTPENRLMIGNGGWSYTLNRKDPVEGSFVLPVLTYPSGIASTEPEVVYDGRTPCQEIAAEHSEMHVSDECFKLKWRLILRRDAAGRPTTYIIRKVVDGVAKNVEGTWTITQGTESNPDVMIYTILADRPEESISFLVGDENVLFFLKKDNTLFTGNKDFSFTLNRKLDR